MKKLKYTMTLENELRLMVLKRVLLELDENNHYISHLELKHGWEDYGAEIEFDNIVIHESGRLSGGYWLMHPRYANEITMMTIEQIIELANILYRDIAKGH